MRPNLTDLREVHALVGDQIVANAELALAGNTKAVIVAILKQQIIVRIDTPGRGVLDRNYHAIDVARIQASKQVGIIPAGDGFSRLAAEKIQSRAFAVGPYLSLNCDADHVIFHN